MKISVPPFAQARVLVVGDVMLDRYWRGAVARISPEAPVPVVQVENCDDRVGGAGNVAMNIRALGGSCQLLGLVGEDDAAKILRDLLLAAGVGAHLLPVPGLPTISKLRVVGHQQQLLRLDFEKSFGGGQREQFLATYRERLAENDLVILSDYRKGTLAESAQLIALARAQGKPILVDPKSRDFSDYRGATIITPNLAEFEAVVGSCHNNEQELTDKALDLIDRYDFHAVLVTRGAQGMSLVVAGEPALHLPTHAREVFDVTGAGDTVIATLGIALASGERLDLAVNLANLAAGEVVKKLGTSTVSLEELEQVVRRRYPCQLGILSETQLKQQLELAKLRGEKVVMTNGCFDLLHAGHIRYLEQARSLGDRLIVAVNDDESVKRLKGSARPVNQLPERMQLLAALGVVDWVVDFTEDTPERLIRELNPEILVKGGDYQVEQIAGAPYVLQQGGEVRVLPFAEGFSTTALIKRIREAL